MLEYNLLEFTKNSVKFSAVEFLVVISHTLIF